MKTKRDTLCYKKNNTSNLKVHVLSKIIQVSQKFTCEFNNRLLFNIIHNYNDKKTILFYLFCSITLVKVAYVQWNLRAIND